MEANTFDSVEGGFRALAESSPFGIFHTDASGTCTYSNPAWHKMSGLSAEECRRTGWATRIHPDDQAQVFSDWQRSKDGGANLSAVFRLRLPDGSVRHVRVESRPLVLDGIQVGGHVGTAIDVTDQVRAEEKAARSNVVLSSDVSQGKRAVEAALAHRLLDAIVESIPLPVFVKDARDLKYLRVNRAVEEMIGLSRADIVGKDDRELFPADAAAAICLRDREVIAGNDGGEAGRPLQTRGKGLRFMLSRRVVVRDELNRPALLLGIAQDVTEARARENEVLDLNAALQKRTQEAEAGNRAKDAFLATISHEMRTPMNGMLGLLELLSLSRLDAQQRRSVATIRASSESLKAILDAVLDLSSMEAGVLRLEYAPGSVRELLDSLQSQFSPACREKGLAFTLCVDPTISNAVEADFHRLRQILGNFLSNALKFTTCGSILLAVEMLSRSEGAEHLKFLVSDTGVGVSGEDRQHVFAAFRKGDPMAGRLAGGMGLGLVICRKLAELMGGAVEMASEPGKGTEITLTLAVRVHGPQSLPDGAGKAASGANGGPTGREETPSRQEGRTALIVDDHPTNRALMLRQMAVLGYVAESADDGEQALEKWRSRRFGIIVTDCEMPGMDGFELARRIRTIEAVGDHMRVPIIACSAHVLPGIREKCLAAGMDDFLPKPSSLAAMRKTLKQWLPFPSRRDE